MSSNVLQKLYKDEHLSNTFLDKKKLNDIAFSKDITENNLSKKSFIQSFLASVKSKMYRGR